MRQIRQPQLYIVLKVSFNLESKLKKQSNLNSAKNQNVLLFFAIVVLVVGGIYFLGIFRGTEIEELVNSSKTQDPSLDAITKAEAKIPPLQTQDFDFQELIKSNSCSSLGTLCEDIGLKNPHESIILAQNQVIVYVNIDFIPTEDVAEEFQKLSPSQKAEFVMGEKGTHPRLIEEVIKRNPSHLLVVGFKNLDNIISTRHLLNISYKQLPTMNEALHEFLFGEIFYNGKFNRYRKYVGYYSAFSNL
jgi:hypothetical protein